MKGKITLIKWDLFSIKSLSPNKLQIDYSVNAENLKKWQGYEQVLMDRLTQDGINFEYVRLIPDDLLESLWPGSGVTAFSQETKIAKYAAGVAKSYQKLAGNKPRVLSLSKLMQDTSILEKYRQTFADVYTLMKEPNRKKLVAANEFEKEKAFRQKIYMVSEPDSKWVEDLVCRAIAMFVAEAEAIQQLGKLGILVNPTLLTRYNAAELDKYQIASKYLNQDPIPKINLF